MSDDYYVYLLVEASADESVADRVFYVGKGHDSRALQHVLEYVQALENNEEAVERWRRAEFFEQPTDEDPLTPQNIRDLEHEKIKEMRRAYNSGHTVRIDILRLGLTSQTAYKIESAVIDAIGLENLANRAAGHVHFRAPAIAVDKMLTAAEVTVNVPGLQVTVSGVWGGRSVAGLVDAEPEQIWENARQTWSLSSRTRGLIETAAASEEPLVLAAISKGPTALWGGIILGIWEIDSVEPGQDRRQVSKETGDVSYTPGWEFVAREPVSARLESMRTKWVTSPSRSTVRGQVGVRGIGGLALSRRHP